MRSRRAAPTFEPQDPSAATYASKLTKAEARLDWRESAASLERRVRALNPASCRGNDARWRAAARPRGRGRRDGAQRRARHDPGRGREGRRRHDGRWRACAHAPAIARAARRHRGRDRQTHARLRAGCSSEHARGSRDPRGGGAVRRGRRNARPPARGRGPGIHARRRAAPGDTVNRLRHRALVFRARRLPCRTPRPPGHEARP